MAFLKASAIGMKGSLEEFQVCLFLCDVLVFLVTKITSKHILSATNKRNEGT